VLLDVRTLTKRYGTVPVLNGVSLALDAGETLAIIGPSGCGKSTVLNCIGGLDRPDGGSVLIDGVDLAGLDDAARARMRAQTIGLVFQDHHLLPQLSVSENVLLPTLALAQRTPRAEADARARALLDQVGLGAVGARRPYELSGGERQRVAVARAMINRPRLLLADEPTGALDQAAADALAETLLALNREHGTALIIVTHAAALARRMGRVVTLAGGVVSLALSP
jgi:ABC-type lipoprotein export system ATPase subunit